MEIERTTKLKAMKMKSNNDEIESREKGVY